MGRLLEKTHQIEFHNRVRWNIWRLILEAAMHEDVGINCPDSVSESLQ